MLEQGLHRVHEVDRLQPGYSRSLHLCLRQAVYVDDLIIATKTPEEMQEVKQLLSLQFQMKDMGELHYCLGITICLARNPVTHSRSKHIDVRYHYIREALNNSIIKLQYCLTHDMLANTLTKPLPKGRFDDWEQYGTSEASPHMISKWEC